MSVASITNMYYVSFIDDFSHKILIYFLKTNDVVLRSNNRGKYTSKKLEGFCKEAGIKRELTILYNPQKNGVEEQNNQPIITVAKAMIQNQDLSMFFWVKACNTAIYIQN